MVHLFHESAEFDHSFFESLISLIPKVKGPAFLNDFEPISHLGWVHKLVARIFTPQLRIVVDRLISHTQTAFNLEWGIYGGWVIALEIVNVMKRNKEGIVFKLNFENAYDHVNWHFLSFVLRMMSFGERWAKWIFRCIFVAPIFILVNGSQVPKFHMECGLC